MKNVWQAFEILKIGPQMETSGSSFSSYYTTHGFLLFIIFSFGSGKLFTCINPEEVFIVLINIWMKSSNDDAWHGLPSVAWTTTRGMDYHAWHGLPTGSRLCWFCVRLKTKLLHISVDVAICRHLWMELGVCECMPVGTSPMFRDSFEFNEF